MQFKDVIILAKVCPVAYHFTFPLRRPNLLQCWLNKMKHPLQQTVNKHAKICSVHFKGGKKNGEGDKPTLFPWSRKPPKDRPIPYIEPPASPKYKSVGVNTENLSSTSTGTNTCELPQLHQLTQTVTIALSLSIENISASDRQSIFTLDFQILIL